MAILPKLIYTFNAIKIPTDFVLGIIDMLTLQCTKKFKKTTRAKNSLEKKGNDFDVYFLTSNFPTK
jgi:hypothetical protein